MSAYKIVSFKARRFKLWNRVFRKVNIITKQKQFLLHRHFKPSKTRFAFDKAPVGINSLNNILPDMCDAAGFKRKTAHSLRVTCVSSLFNSEVEEKLIRERSGHRSNALLQYEKPTEENVSKVSKILGPSVVSTTTCSTTEKQDESLTDVVFQKGKFKNCTINVTISKKE